MSVISRLLARADDSAPDRLVIEPMRRRHLREVLPIEVGAYPKSWSRSVFESELEQVKVGSRCYLVGLIDKRVVGYAGLWFVDDPDGDQAHVTNIVVDPSRRREGVATQLMLALATVAIEQGCVAWTLEVRASSSGRACPVPQVRVCSCRGTQALLREHRRRDRDVVSRHPLRRVRGPTGSACAMTPDESTLVLGIETSCDETAAALVMGGYDVISSVVSSQIEIHADFGGVVPEIASRAHLDALNPVVARAIVEAGVDDERIDAVACTIGPGLIGALLVGVSAAKSLALAWDVPFVGVNHLEAHLYAAFLEDPSLEFPLVVLLVSGGHTMLVEMRGHGQYRLLGQTIDDAAGEAFDKVARFLGLGYPGGPAVDVTALNGDPDAIRFPRALSDDRDNLDFSFSGLKTAVMNYVRKHPDVASADVAASFQMAVVDVLVKKARRAAEIIGAKGIVLGGGVAANSLLARGDAGCLRLGGCPRLLAQSSHVHGQCGDDRRHGLVSIGERRADRTRRRRLSELEVATARRVIHTSRLAGPPVRGCHRSPI